MEFYVLLSEAALREANEYLREDRKLLEEIYLAVASEPVLEIREEALALLKENLRLWKQGYAIPIEALKEAKRFATGNPFMKSLKRGFKAVLSAEELEAEPDANYLFAREFCSSVKGSKILDLASGFGWVPVLLSRRAKVYALDSAYENKIIYEPERIRIEGTTIELFPDFPEAQNFIRANKEIFTCYADFAKLFWEKQGANMENITLLAGSGENLSSLRELSGAPLKLEDASFDAVTIFFGLNHVGMAWCSVLKEASRILRKHGKLHAAIYREYLARFPIKGAYNWAQQLGVEIITLEELLNEAKALNLEARIRHHSGENLYYMVEMEKM